MPDRRLSNARIQGWLAADLDRVAEEMDCPKALVNSAAVWWFCQKLPAAERAKILGEFVTAQALRGQAEQPAPDAPDGKPTRRKPKRG